MTVHRETIEEIDIIKSSPKSSPKTEIRILELIRNDPNITTEKLGSIIGITKRAVLKQIEKLKEEGVLRRVGAHRGGLRRC